MSLPLNQTSSSAANFWHDTANEMRRHSGQLEFARISPRLPTKILSLVVYVGMSVTEERPFTATFLQLEQTELDHLLAVWLSSTSDILPDLVLMRRLILLMQHIE